MFTLILITLVSILVFLLVYRKVKTDYSRTHSKLPNGPAGIPVLGNILPMLLTYPHLKLFQWAEKYGDLFTIYLGRKPTLVINDAKLLKQLLNMYPATGKFKTEIFLLISRGPYGIVMTEENQHSDQRTFCLKALKEFGYGTKVLANKMLEISLTCSYIENKIKSGKSQFAIYGIMKHAMANNLWTFVTGKRLEGDDSKRVVQLLENFIETFQYSAKTGLCFISWFKHVAPKLSGYEALDKACENLHDFVEKGFNEEKSSWKKGEPPRHVIDCYIEHLSKCENSESSFYGEVGIKNSISSIAEMFIGGVEATAATLTWLMIYLSWFPNIQEKLQKEVDGIIGSVGNPSIEDRPRMPYTEAVILEAQRYSSIIPLGIIHELLDDIPDFEGYSLPKGLLILPNLYTIQHSEKIWHDPENFRPERFLDSSANALLGSDGLRENMVSFQPGRRSCLGEPIAKDFMFLMVTHLFQRFSIQPVPTIPKEKYFDANVGFGLIPRDLELKITRR